MAYTTYSEIEADFKDITFSASTGNVRQADVTQFIVEADSLINAYVAKRYTTPVTGSGEGLSLLKLCSRSLVTARIKKLMEVVQEKSTEANQAVQGVLLSPSAVMKILTDIRDDLIDLVGATALVSGRGFHSENVTQDVTPTIEKGTRQW